MLLIGLREQRSQSTPSIKIVKFLNFGKKFAKKYMFQLKTSTWSNCDNLSSRLKQCASKTIFKKKPITDQNVIRWFLALLSLLLKHRPIKMRVFFSIQLQRDLINVIMPSGQTPRWPSVTDLNLVMTSRDWNPRIRMHYTLSRLIIKEYKVNPGKIMVTTAN